MVSQRSVAWEKKVKVLEEAVEEVVHNRELISPLSVLVKWLEERGIKFGKMAGKDYDEDQLGEAVTNLIKAGKLRVMWLSGFTEHENEFLVRRVPDDW